MADEIVIKVESLNKTFKLPHEKSGSIKSAIVGFTKRKKTYERQHVLQDINFEVKKGEFFGIVGRNGSGKSTLLKLLAGIYSPDSGGITINGRLTPFIELGVGFNPELSGRENVYLNGALLGFGRSEMNKMYEDIVRFAEIERFMDAKLKNYSSGMQVRLAFSIAIRARTGILLIDEVLAVGDASFQQKCFDYFEKLKSNKDQTVVFISHDMSSVKRFCDRCILINDGVIIERGDPYVVASGYMALNSKKADAIEKADNGSLGGVAISNTRIKKNDLLKISIDYSMRIPARTIVGLSIIRDDNTYICGMNNVESKRFDKTGSQRLEFNVYSNGLFAGDYYINVSLYDKDFKLIDHKLNAVGFKILGNKMLNSDGAVELKYEVV